jgi:glycosyltransferase involved in cell wall biosynthesis
MRILIATVQVPFVRGGAEAHAEGLRAALCAAGHEVEIVSVPFKGSPPERVVDQMLACRLLDLTESAGVPVDRVIGLKFPAYLAQHPDKVLWILHQHRSAYDLWDNTAAGDLVHSPEGPEVREAVRVADRRLLREARAVYANSRNVARRLKHYCGIRAEPLYHPPPQAEAYYCAADDPVPYLFCPSRLTPLKRHRLILEALARTRRDVRVRFAGRPDCPGHAEELRRRAVQLGVSSRVVWLGEVSEVEKQRQYAHSRGVVFVPVDEDYGYVTLEAMLAAKPVITCTDSGGPLEFVADGQTGRVVEPVAEALAGAFDQLWMGRDAAVCWGAAGRDRYESLGISWDNVVARLTA